MEQVVFWAMALASFLTAFAMLLSPNAVHSALALVGNFFALAILYVLLDAHFLAAAQIIVYAGAIMVLFLFVIMLLGVDREEDTTEPIRFHRGAALALGAALAGILYYVLREAFSGRPFAGLAEETASGNVESLGRLLFSKYLFPFEVTSLLLIVAAIGAIVVGKRRRSEGPPEEEEEP